jgi:hypothetical protein
MSHWWLRVGLFFVLLQCAPTTLWGQIPIVHAEAVGAHTAYLQGVVAMSALDYAQAVRHFERAVQRAPTNTVYAQMLSFARKKLQEPPLPSQQKGPLDAPSLVMPDPRPARGL